MLNAQDEQERYDQSLEKGFIDQDTYDQLIGEINLDDIYEVSALNEEGMVEITVQYKDVDDEER